MGKLGQGEELSIQKTRHHGHKEETGGELPSSESSCLSPDSYLSDTEGRRSADTITSIHETGAGERNEYAICGATPLGTDVLPTAPPWTAVCALAKGHTGGASRPAVFTWVFTLRSLMSYFNDLLSLRHLSASTHVL